MDPLDVFSTIPVKIPLCIFHPYNFDLSRTQNGLTNASKRASILGIYCFQIVQIYTVSCISNHSICCSFVDA